MEDNQNTPLAARMVPRDLSEFVGQNHILGPGKLLRRAIEADRISSAVFYGPPGTGKSALAYLIAKKTKARTEELNAATAGVAELKRVLERARLARAGSGLLTERTPGEGQRTLVVLDEIHHFNRTQQDTLLPAVEKGEITLIGLTTENPFFYVNAALLSRFTAFEFFPLAKEDLKTVLENTLKSPSGLKDLNACLDRDAEEHLLQGCGGDARRLLNALELAALTTAPDSKNSRRITLLIAEESIQKRAIRYDKSSDEHYDHISAFIKSMRGSDPDAAIYWMAKMISAGEDPRFIARRILICASEDVGNADPQALVVAAAAFQAVEFVGMPEAKIPLSQAAIYVACAPKSNSAYKAIVSAMEEVEKGKPREVPNHLRDPNLDAEKRGHGKGYLYPHDYPGHRVKQAYMPDPKKFYIPSGQGLEKN